MSEGYIALHRKIEGWEWYKDSNTLRLFLHLLLNANHKDGKWQGMEIKRGQLVTGRKKISNITGLSQQTIRSALTRLKSTSEITIKSTNKYSLITIVNYDIYQHGDEKSTSTSTSQPTNNQPATNHKQECNNENNKNKGGRRFTPPVISEVIEYAKAINFTPLITNPNNFLDYYESTGWCVGKKPMRDWKAAMRTWKSRQEKSGGGANERRRQSIAL